MSTANLLQSTPAISNIVGDPVQSPQLDLNSVFTDFKNDQLNLIDL